MYNRGVPNLSFESHDKSALTLLTFGHWNQLNSFYNWPSQTAEDLIWHVSWFFHNDSDPRPGWAGFMNNINTSSEPCVPVAITTMHPIQDRNPNDPSCIYSTLVYVEQKAKMLNIPTTCITFDHPLWLKAIDIVHSKKMNIVCRLGPFHTLMSFLGRLVM